MTNEEIQAALDSGVLAAIMRGGGYAILQGLTGTNTFPAVTTEIIEADLDSGVEARIWRGVCYALINTT